MEPNVQPDPMDDAAEPAPSPRGSGPLTLLDPAPAEEAERPQAAPRWGLAKKILFRFAFAYLVLYNLPFPLEYIPYVGQGYRMIWHTVVPMVGWMAFGADIEVFPNGSGDTTYDYVQVFCFLILALLATAIWSYLDRKRAQYARLDDWLRVYVRFSLAATMITYGAMKVIPAQFMSPSLDRLLQPFGEASPMGLLWTFMGASAAYTIFAGASELLAGLLFISRRTTLLGALMTIGVMGNVVMLNFSYDVPVKLFSSHLLLMGVFLVLPDLRRLIDLLVLNRPVEPAVIRPLFQRKWLHRGALVLRTVFILGITVMMVRQSYQQRQEYGPAAAKPPLYGIWNVDEFVVDGVARPPLVTDEERWRRMVFDFPGMVAIMDMNNARQRFFLEIDTVKRRLEIKKRDDPKWKSTLSYRQLEPELLVMEGTFDGHKVRAKLRRQDESKFLLVSRGFRWINEYPFNR